VPAELPPPPSSIWRIVGPGIVGAGVGLGSGEFVLFPYIASQVGLVFLWAAFLSIAVQFFINMEVERYTLATGEAVLTGFSRLGRHWGLAFAVMAVASVIWPGWSVSSATLLTYLFGGDARWIASGMLVAVGAMLTLSPVVLRTLERTAVIKVAAVATLFVVALLFAIPAQIWIEAPGMIARPALPVVELGWALILGATAYAGMGGASNLCQSNWIRDKGYGMGAHAPRIVSPILGEPVAQPGVGWRFEVDDEARKRWAGWWRLANIEQLSTFVAISTATILFTSVLAYALLAGHPGLPRDISFLAIEGAVLADRVGGWFGAVFWAVGAFALFMTTVGTIDVTARLTADVIHTSYGGGKSESLVYSVIVWVMVAAGVVTIASGLDQPLVLLVISASLSGFMMFVYSWLLIVLNRKLLPTALRPTRYRIAALVFSTLLFGAISVATIYEQVVRLITG
jgi:hypothetical protein